MERNDDLPTGSSSASGGTAGGSSGMSGAGTSGGSFDNTSEASRTPGYGTGQTSLPESERNAGGVQNRLADVGSTVKDRAADLGSTVRDKAGSAKNSLADMLETGADKLRQRAQGSGTSGATGTPAYAGDANANMAAVSDGRTAEVTDRVATGMQATADWLRDADLDSMKSGIERQVKEHPGRTLLIALGVGYVLGKAFRK